MQIGIPTEGQVEGAHLIDLLDDLVRKLVNLLDTVLEVVLLVVPHPRPVLLKIVSVQIDIAIAEVLDNVEAPLFQRLEKDMKGMNGKAINVRGVIDDDIEALSLGVLLKLLSVRLRNYINVDVL